MNSINYSSIDDSYKINTSNSTNIDNLLNTIFNKVKNILDTNIKISELIELSGLSEIDIKYYIDKNGNEVFTLSEKGLEKINRVTKFFIITIELNNILDEPVKKNIENSVNYFNKNRSNSKKIPTLQIVDLLENSKKELLQQLQTKAPYFYSLEINELVDNVFSKSVEKALLNLKEKKEEINLLLKNLSLNNFETYFEKNKVKNLQIKKLINLISNNDYTDILESSIRKNKTSIEKSRKNKSIKNKTREQKKDFNNTSNTEGKNKICNFKNTLLFTTALAIGSILINTQQSSHINDNTIDTSTLTKKTVNPGVINLLHSKSLINIPKKEMLSFFRNFYNEYNIEIKQVISHYSSNNAYLKNKNIDKTTDMLLLKVYTFIASKGINVNNVNISIEVSNNNLHFNIESKIK